MQERDIPGSAVAGNLIPSIRPAADLVARCPLPGVIQWSTVRGMLQPVAELPEYQRAVGKLLSADEDRRAVLDFLAARPRAGALIEGTGGVRKLRWARDGRGKSGGVRVIYYFHSEAMPLYLLTMFAKNERANLSKAERNELAGLVDLLVQLWFER